MININYIEFWFWCKIFKNVYCYPYFYNCWC